MYDHQNLSVPLAIWISGGLTISHQQPPVVITTSQPPDLIFIAAILYCMQISHSGFYCLREILSFNWLVNNSCGRVHRVTAEGRGRAGNEGKGGGSEGEQSRKRGDEGKGGGSEGEQSRKRGDEGKGGGSEGEQSRKRGDEGKGGGSKGEQSRKRGDEGRGTRVR